jgi:hypothetical protein
MITQLQERVTTATQHTIWHSAKLEATTQYSRVHTKLSSLPTRQSKQYQTRMRAFLSFLLTSALCLHKHCMGLSLDTHSNSKTSLDRRTFTQRIAAIPFLPVVLAPQAVTAAESLQELQTIAQKARKQLDPVTAIIEKEEWDKVRAILITPPISDFWTKSKRPTNLAKDIADAVGDAGGDEFNVLELRDELQSHLRYLDMAVYNNVFNPITVEGTAGATKELVRSYYEDPKNELKASLSALDGILKEIADTIQ